MKIIIVIFFVVLFGGISAQDSPFQVYIEPLEIPEVGGLQVFAHAQHNGKWLILGGRLDGLHRRQPWASFDEAGMNTQITVIDPGNK